jgi:hypothetical protein
MNIKSDKNDILFSKMIRERDGNKCVFCGRTAAQGWKMTCSHFWGRGDKLNRFNPKNCDTLCFMCHTNNEGNKQGMYREWKINQLGNKEYTELEKSHYQGYKKYGKFEKALLQTILKEQFNNKEYLKAGWTVKF